MGDAVAVGDDQRRARRRPPPPGRPSASGCRWRPWPPGRRRRGRRSSPAGPGPSSAPSCRRRRTWPPPPAAWPWTLPAGVGVDLRVQHQHVDVGPGGQHVVEPAVADVVGPAVAADDPDAALAPGRRPGRAGAGRPACPAAPRASFSAATRSRWAAIPASVRWSASSSAADEGRVEGARQAGQQLAGVLGLLVQREADAQPELGVVLEERVGPGRPAPVRVLGPGRGGQVAAVDRGAAGGVGDHRAVAEQLGQQLEVGRLAAAGAGPGELEQRLQQLDVLDRAQVEPGAVDVRQGQEEVPVRPARRRAAGPGAPC